MGQPSMLLRSGGQVDRGAFVATLQLVMFMCDIHTLPTQSQMVLVRIEERI
jgi:hypothetical protein